MDEFRIIDAYIIPDEMVLKYVLSTECRNRKYTFYFDRNFVFTKWREERANELSMTDLGNLPYVVYNEFVRLDIRQAFRDCIQRKIDTLQRQIDYFKKDLTSI